MSMSANERVYFTELLSQGQENLNICPTCFKNQKRKKCCTNMVMLCPEKVLVCCYLGDKHEISKNAFKKKIKEMKRKSR